MRARVYVTLKRGVLDPQGKAVAGSLVSMGFHEVQDLHIGKFIELQLEETDEAAAKKRITEMCERLLANTVIEDFRVEILGS
jgi:phosphoribosylformylglycinamidine synthase